MDGLTYGILGPTEVWRDGEAVPLPAPRQRAVLAALLLRANHVLSAEQLIQRLWDEEPPPTARTTLQSLVFRLRHQLEPGATGSRAAQVLLTRPSGYLLRVQPGQLDLHRFEECMNRGRAAFSDGRLEPAATAYREALALWRGPALVDVAGEGLYRLEGPRLLELRLRAVEGYFEAALMLGKDAELVGELRALVAEQPLREWPHGQLMVALYRSRRRGEALETYQRLRRILLDELGVEPGPALRRLHQQILDGDPALEPADGTPIRAVPRNAFVPRQLPPGVDDFTGRAAEVAWLAERLTVTRTRCPGATLGVSVSGAAGTGKTTLAVHVGHRVRDRFRDGQFFVDLRGMDPNPITATVVLGQFLVALGVAPAAIPESVEERQCAYRTLIADRRVLLVLDNAAGEAQVHPLLPSSDRCGVLITSRRPLVIEGMPLLPLDLLSSREAVTLLGRIVGLRRVSGQAADAERIAELCGRLPLALRIAGTRLASRPDWPLARLATKLSGTAHRLDELDTGELAVRASLELSLRGLPEPERQAFRLLGAVPGQDFAVWLAAALLDLPADRAEDVIERLVDHRLVEPAGQRRYRYHDLVADLARERLEREEPPERRRAALCRGLDACVDLLDRAAIAVKRGDREPFTWFAAERATLVAAVERAAAAGLSEHAWRIAHACAMFFGVRADWDDWRHTHEVALAAAHADGLRTGEAALRCGLGQLELDRGRAGPAREHLLRAVDSCRGIGNLELEAYAHRALGEIYIFEGRHPEAIACLTIGLRLARQAGDRAGEVSCLRCLGLAYRDTGRLAEAVGTLEAAVAILRGGQDRLVEPYVLATLGGTHLDAGQTTAAAPCFERAIVIARELGDIRAQVHAMRGLADTRRIAGGLAEASTILQHALRIVRERGDDLGEVQTLRRLGETLTEQGHHDQATRSLHQALRIVRAVGFPRIEAEVRYALGVVQLKRGSIADAAESFDSSRAVFREHGLWLGYAHATLGLGHATGQLGNPTRAERLHRHVARLLGDGRMWYPGRPGVVVAAGGDGLSVAVAEKLPLDGLRHAGWAGR